MTTSEFSAQYVLYLHYASYYIAERGFWTYTCCANFTWKSFKMAELFKFEKVRSEREQSITVLSL